jgi:hypothetical protein
MTGIERAKFRVNYALDNRIIEIIDYANLNNVHVEDISSDNLQRIVTGIFLNYEMSYFYNLMPEQILEEDIAWILSSVQDFFERYNGDAFEEIREINELRAELLALIDAFGGDTEDNNIVDILEAIALVAESFPDESLAERDISADHHGVIGFDDYVRMMNNHTFEHAPTEFIGERAIFPEVDVK